MLYYYSILIIKEHLTMTYDTNMTYDTKDAEYEVTMIISKIIQSQYIQNPNNEYYQVHLPALMNTISSIPDRSEGMARLKFLIGSYDSMQNANTGTAIVGVGSTAYATTCILQAKNPVSKTFYILGASCSAMGTCMSTYSGLFGDSCCYNFGGLDFQIFEIFYGNQK